MEIERTRNPRSPNFPIRDRQQLPPIAEVLQSQKISFHRGSSSTKRRWRLMAWSLAAGVIDILIIFSATCFISGILIAAMGWKVTLAQLQSEVSLQAALLMMILGFYAIYLLTLRVFIGCTLGEWACGLRLGEPRHRLSPGYSLKVHLRLLVILGSGIVTLPLLSLILGIDLAGKLSGLPLVSYSAK